MSAEEYLAGLQMINFLGTISLILSVGISLIIGLNVILMELKKEAVKMKKEKTPKTKYFYAVYGLDFYAEGKPFFYDGDTDTLDLHLSRIKKKFPKCVFCIRRKKK